jgi:hypothetical protein
MTRFPYSDNDPVALTSNFLVCYYWGVEIFQLEKNKNAASVVNTV